MALASQVYVWQNAWTSAVRGAVAAHRESFGRLVVLGAEVTLASDGSGATRYADVPWKQLAEAGGEVGVALRVGAFDGEQSEASASTEALVAVAAELLRRARAGGVEPRELQVDYDAPTRQLAGYTGWLRALRARVDVPLTLTTLPSWLADREAFGALVGAADGFVLQVHSLERPGRVDQPIPPLCDVERAKRWIREAAAHGRPFRVALPTYGYRLAFGPDGGFVGLSAEAAPRAARPGTQWRVVRSRPGPLAKLVATLRRDRPEQLSGVIWYRLPTGEDTLAWRWQTLEAVMAGRVPEAMPEVRLSRVEGLVEVGVMNVGEADAALPRLTLGWREGELLASDGTVGYELSEDRATSVSARPTLAGSLDVIPPGETRAVGWLRFDRRDVEVTCELIP